MSDFSPNHFFQLSSFKHAKLFDGSVNVWEALPRIGSYLNSLKLGVIESDVPSNAYLINRDQISIGKNVTIEPGAYIKGPCVIGDNSTVRHGAYIRGDVIVGQHSVVGHDSELKNSVMLDQCHAAHFAYVGDCILGNGVNLGAGTKCANLRLDNKPIVIIYENAKIETGLRKFGAILGDGCQTGCNTVTNPGTVLGKHVYCYPCTNIGGVISSENTIRNDTSLIITPNRR